MQESAVQKPPEGNIGESGKQDYQTPDIYEIGSLRVDSKLPDLKIHVLRRYNLYRLIRTSNFSKGTPKNFRCRHFSF